MNLVNHLKAIGITGLMITSVVSCTKQGSGDVNKVLDDGKKQEELIIGKGSSLEKAIEAVKEGKLSLYSFEALAPALLKDSNAKIPELEKSEKHQYESILRGKAYQQLTYGFDFNEGVDFRDYTFARHPSGLMDYWQDGSSSVAKEAAVATKEQLEKLTQIIYTATRKAAAETANMVVEEALSTGLKEQVIELNKKPEPSRSEALAKLVEESIASKQNSAWPSQLDEETEKAKIAKGFVKEEILNILKQLSPNQYQNLVDKSLKIRAVESLIKTAGAAVDFANGVYQLADSSGAAIREVSVAVDQLKRELMGVDSNKLPTDLDAWRSYEEKLRSFQSFMEGKSDGKISFANEPQKQAAFDEVKRKVDELNRTTAKFSETSDMLLKLAKLAGADSETLNKIQEVSKFANSANKLVNALSSGGVVGAVTAAGEILGGGVDIGQARHAEIVGKLDELLAGQRTMIKMQRITIDLQMQTLQSILELANFIDLQHREAMLKLRDIQFTVDRIADAQVSLIRQDLVRCDFAIANRRMANFESNALLLKKSSGELLSSFESLKEHFSDSKVQDLTRCAQAIRYIYSDENALLSLLSMSSRSPIGKADGTPKSDLLAYKAMGLRTLIGNDRNVSSFSSGSHLPLIQLSAVELKKKSVLENSFSGTLKYQEYLFASLVPLDTLSVQAEVGSLLEYMKVLSAKINYDSFTKNGQFVEDKELKENLQMAVDAAASVVESAIAQEAIIAGESVLPNLAKKIPTWKDMKVKDCVSNINDFSGFCEVVNNVTLRKNLVNYFMQTEIRKRTDKKNLVEIAVPDQLEYQIQYDQLSNVKNSSAVRTYFGEDFVKTYLVEGSEAMGPQIRFGDLLILLPTPAEYSMDHIYYNNSMKKLLELRASLAMAQAKIKSTPEDVTKLDLILRGILQ